MLGETFCKKFPPACIQTPRLSPAAAIACIILFYPVHRQTLPSSAFFISESVGLGVSLSRAVMVNTMPGVQKPHCTAPFSKKLCCTFVRCSPCARPSMVVISASWQSTARVRHERIGLSSRSTVQLPHSPVPQPSFAPVNSSCSRSASSNVV